MMNATICFLLICFLFFLISIFDVRRYNGAYLSCAYVPRKMKFTKFIDESVEKNNQFPANTGAKMFEQKCLFL